MDSVHISNESHELERAYLRLLDETVQQKAAIIYSDNNQLQENKHQATHEPRTVPKLKNVDHSIY